MAARSHHDVLQKHAVVHQRATAQDAIHGEHQTNGCIKKLVVALVLGVHLVLVAFGNTEQPIQAPAVFTPAVYVGRHPLFRVVVVFFPVLCGQCRVSAQGIVRRTNFCHQRIAAATLQDVGSPGLGVGTRWCPDGHFKQVRDKLTRHGFGQKFAHRLAAVDGIVNSVGCVTCIDKGHFKVSSTESNCGGKATGWRVMRST